MYIVNQYQPRIFLFSNDNPQEIIKFDSYEEFLDWATDDFIRHKIANKFEHRLLIQIFGGGLDLIHYVVKDEFGSMYSVNEIRHDYYERKKTYTKQNRWFEKWNHLYEFRKDPVPGTGTHHYRFGNIFRSPKTTQELRRNDLESEFARGKRRKDYLPSSWEDVLRSDYRERKNWKRNRKTQWKVR